MLELPRPAPVFIGRQDELERILAELQRCNLVVLEGPAGSGKTALALQLGERLRTSGQKAIWWQARSGDNAESLLLELAQSFLSEQARPQSERMLDGALALGERIRLLASVLSGSKTFLFIDDFHHLSDGGQLLTTMKDYLRGVALIATSRHQAQLDPLSKVDCLVVRMEAMAEADGDALLSVLLEQHGLDEWLQSDHFQTLKSKGYSFPLSIKLMVSLLIQNRRTSLADMAATHHELYQQLISQLEGGLDDRERRALRLLSVYRRPVPHQALGEGQAEVVASLQRKLLVDAAGGQNFATHDVFKDYYRAHLPAQQSVQLHRYCGEFLAGTHLNLQAAQEAIFHLQRGQNRPLAAEVLADQGKSLFQAAQYEYLLRTIPELKDEAGAAKFDLETLRAEVLALVGQVEQSLQLFTEIEQSGDLGQRTRAMNSRCHLLLEQGLLEEAIAVAQDCLNAFERQTGRRPGRVKALNALALAQARQGVRGALETACRSLSICREIDDPRGACYAHYARSLWHRHADAWVESLDCAREAIAAAAEANEVRLAYLARYLEGTALQAMGECEMARRLLLQAEKDSQDYHDPLSRALSCLGAALVSPAPQAPVFLEQAESNWRRHGGRVFGAQLYLSAATIADALASEDRARNYLQSGIRLAEQAGATPLLAELWIRRASLDPSANSTLDDWKQNADQLGLEGTSLRISLMQQLEAIRKGKTPPGGLTETTAGTQEDRRLVDYLLASPQTPPPLDAGYWSGPLRRLQEAKERPFRITTEAGSRRVDEATVIELRASPEAFDLWLDLPQKCAYEKNKGQLTLLRRKVVTRLLLSLLRATGRAFSQKELFLEVWGPPYQAESSDAQVRKNISALRDLLETDRSSPRYVRVREATLGDKGGYYFPTEVTFCLIEKLS